MGAIKLIIGEMTNKDIINMDFSKSMLNMKCRGEFETTYFIESNIQINRTNEQLIKRTLSRDQLARYKNYKIIYGYHRLAINDTSFNATQPFEDPIQNKLLDYPELRTRVNRKLMCNGEIYNYSKLISEFTDRDFQSTSDVEVILPLYIKYGLIDTLSKLDGDYTFVLTENINTFNLDSMNIFVARDPFGIRPLYFIRKNSEFYMFVTELKGVPMKILSDKSFSISEFPIGSFWSFQNPLQFTKFHDWDSYFNSNITSTSPDQISSIYSNIESKLTESVIKKSLTNISQPIGVLLSGGFDSSIITSILAKHSTAQIHTFSLSNDCSELISWLESKYNIDIIHHNVLIDDSFFSLFNIQQLIERNIYIIESYCPQTIRDSIVFTLLFEYIQTNTNVKILLSGEGIDELFPNSKLSDLEFQSKSINSIKQFCKYDKLERLSSHYGLEIRHPFLDTSLVEYILDIHPNLRRSQFYEANKPPIEKYIIRKSFEENSYLPYNTLWRRMNKLNNSYYDKIISVIIELCSKKYTETDYELYINSKQFRGCSDKPKCLESMYYRKLFERSFGTNLIL
jgi:asparagine synthase (glutamine-hydrolysing)